MSLTTAEITDLLRRAQLSEARGYSIARADVYARELGGNDGSPAGLAALCRAALHNEVSAAENAPKLTEGASSKKPKALPEEAMVREAESASPEPPSESDSSEPEPEPEPEPAETPEEDVHDDSAEAYESWSKKKLLATAQERGLGVNAHNTKAEIIEALRAAD